jgi:myo-inositol 2-dehydrogenase/D-chiro-inositol 1-dehydrogenase
MERNGRRGITRRDFIVRGAVAASAISGLPFLRTSGAEAVRPLKVGLIGCGGRGTSSLVEALQAAPGIRVTALADPFRDRVDQCLRYITNRTRMRELLAGVDVKPDHCFAGLDGYKRLLETDVDWVNLVGPPGFRHRHFAEAVEAGKHVFMEKPVATDPVAVRKILQTAKKAKEKGLSVVVGFDNRHNPSRMEAVRRIHNGAIGDVVSGTSYNYTSWTRWYRGDDPSWSEMEYQCRNWYYFCWLSGDVIVEQSIHTIDVTNWVMGAYPISALGQGGRQIPLGPRMGNIWDHMTVDYEYPNDVHVIHMDRQWPDCHGSGSAGFIGTKGRYFRNEITGQNPWKFAGRLERSGVYEQRDMIESIRTGKPRSEAENGAYAALTAIMGRESAYTGKLVTWKETLNSDLDLFPKKMEFGPAPKRGVPVPGRPRP